MTLFKLGHVVGEDGADGSPGAKGDKGDKGDTGATGNGIQSIVLKSTSGKTKTYRITYTNGTTFDYEVKDGEDGSAASVDIVTSWSGTLSDAKVPSEKLSKNSLDAKAPTSHASSNNTYGLGTTSNYGHVKTINGLTQSSHSDGTALSAYQGKLLKDAIDAKADASSLATVATTGDYDDLTDKPSIPNKISDLQNDSDFIVTSSVIGLIKNDGTVDTNTYLTSSALSNYIQKSNTSGLIKNDGTIDTSTYLTQMKIGSTSGLPVKTGTNGVLAAGSFGTSAGTFAEGNHTHSNYVAATKVTSWQSTPSDSNVPTEKLVKNSLPTKVSDLTNDSGFITSSAISGMLTSSDIADNLTTNDSTKVLSAKQGKALKDLIGAAITYINQ